MSAPDPAAPLVDLARIRAAAETLRGVAVRTPLVALGDPARRHLLKAESLQPIGAFKIRGAYNAAASLSPEERARGLITYSSGNHAQGVARAARLLGVPAVIVMPENAPAIKRARVLADGAEVVTVGNASAERQAVAERLAAERGLAMIPPYDDDRIIAGQGTCGLEIAEDLPDLAAVLVPIGGGGLASGVAAAVKALRPGARVIGVEPELAADAAGVAAPRPDRGVVRRGRLADDRGRDADPGARGPHVRPPAGAARRRRDGERGGDRRRRCGSPPRRRASSWSPPAPSRSRPCASGPRRRASRGRPGPVVCVVSGGNVDPARYLRLPRGADPLGLSRGRGAGGTRRRPGRRRCRRRGRAAAARASSSGLPPPRGRLLVAHPGGDDEQDRDEEPGVAHAPHDRAGQLLVLQRRGRPRSARSSRSGGRGPARRRGSPRRAAS